MPFAGAGGASSTKIPVRLKRAGKTTTSSRGCAHAACSAVPPLPSGGTVVVTDTLHIKHYITWNHMAYKVLNSKRTLCIYSLLVLVSFSLYMQSVLITCVQCRTSAVWRGRGHRSGGRPRLRAGRA